MELIQQLPDWDFVGGSTQERTFQFTDLNGIEYDLDEGVAYFAVRRYVNDGTIVITKQISVEKSQDGHYCSVIVSLTPGDTIDLAGTFTYQILIKDDEGNVAIPYHGRMHILSNIAPDFVR